MGNTIKNESPSQNGSPDEIALEGYFFEHDPELADFEYRGPIKLFDHDGRYMLSVQQSMGLQSYLTKYPNDIRLKAVGYEPSEAEFAVKDDNGRKTGLTQLLPVSKPGPNGVELLLFTRKGFDFPPPNPKLLGQAAIIKVLQQV